MGNGGYARVIIRGIGSELGPAEPDTVRGKHKGTMVDSNGHIVELE